MRFVALFLIVLVCDAPAVARDIYVATNGNDGNTGGPGDPYRTIKYAVGQSIAGDVIHVRAGTYAESWIVIHSGTRVISEDGLYAAKIYSQNSSAVRLTQNDCGIEGFEIYGNWNGGTSPGDGLVRPYASNNTWAKDCLIHDAPLDQDVVKIGANNVLIENCVIYNPSPRTTSGYQECIDVYGTPVPDGVTIRGCWVYHTVERGGDYLTYAKGGSRNILWENNVFGPAASGPSGNCSTSAGGPSPVVFPSADNFVARNNIFVGCSGDGAFGLLSARNVWFYNNIIYNYVGGRAAIEFYTTGVGTNENFYMFNNIILQTNGYPVFADRGKYSGTTYIPANFQHDNNLYYQVNGGGDVNIYLEAHSLFVDPQLVAPATPDRATDTWATIVPDFLLLSTSPCIDAGGPSDYSGSTDIQGDPRVVGGVVDIGVDEYLPQLLASEPPADGTLPKTQNNVILLTFDSAITLPGGPALSIVNLHDSTNVSGSFTYSIQPDGVTLKAKENGAVLVNQKWYRVTPGAGLNVQAFVRDFCTLQGDADGNKQVTALDYFPIKNHPFELTDARYDLDGNGQVTALDYFVVKNHPFDAPPPKP